MKKKLIFALSMIVLLLVSTFTSYALFTFHSDSKVDGSIFTDPIKENYDFAKSIHNSSDTYNIYFFPQARYASAGKIYDPSSDGTLGEFAAKYDKDMIKKYDPTTKTENNNMRHHTEGVSERWMYKSYGKNDGYFIDNDFNYKMENIDGSLSDYILSKVGRPKCDMLDLKGYNVYFTGWTISQKTAIDLGYGGTGNFNLIESTSPLSYIDIIKQDGTVATSKEIEEASKEQNPAIIKGIDGSNICDNEIFLYPIYSSGKDYSTNDKIDCINACIKENGKIIEYNYLSLYSLTNTASFSGARYITRDIRINQNQVKTSIYNIDIMLYLRDNGIFGNEWMADSITVNPKILRLNKIDVSNKTFNTPALNSLNIIPSYDGQNVDFSTSRPGDYNIYVYLYNSKTSTLPTFNETFFPEELKSKEISDIYCFNETSGLGGAQCQCWIYVEEKYDFKVLGGNITSFDYNNTAANICQPMDETGENFIANNVILNNIDKKFTYKAVKDGDTNYFKNGVFTILPVSTNPTYTTTNPLDAIISDFKVKLSTDVNTQKYCEIAKSKDDPKLVGDWDYDLNTDIMKNALEGKLLKIKENGYFVITCKKILDKDKRILEVSVDKIVIPIFVAIYENKDQIKYDTEGFVDYNNMQLPLYVSDEIFNDKITDFNCLYLGDTIDANTKFAVKNQENKYTTLTSVRDIYIKLNNDGKTLYEVTTNKPVLIGGEGVMLRNRVFYIGKKI